MTIKKPMKAPSGEENQATQVAQTGGATIADRFKLDLADPSAKPQTSKATTVAVIAGLLALAVSGVLAYMLWQHWEYLMPA